jgi:hypothetical protein
MRQAFHHSPAQRRRLLALVAATGLVFALATPAAATQCPRGQFLLKSKDKCIDKAEAAKLGLYHGPIPKQDQPKAAPDDAAKEKTAPEQPAAETPARAAPEQPAAETAAPAASAPQQSAAPEAPAFQPAATPAQPVAAPAPSPFGALPTGGFAGAK